MTLEELREVLDQFAKGPVSGHGINPLSLFPCSNSANSLFATTKFAVFWKWLPCSARQGICPLRLGRAAEIGAGNPQEPPKV
jgi:hypothetical protein